MNATLCRVRQSNIQKKIILLLNGQTYSKNLNALQLAVAIIVSIVQLPVHTTHTLQPIDVGPMQTYYNQTLDNWMTEYISQNHVSPLLLKAYLKLQESNTVNLVTKSFYFQ